MTLAQMAKLSGKSALVLREAEINESGPRYVHLKGRKSGLLNWIFARLGADDTTTFDVYEDRIEFSDGSWSGSFTETIPLTRVSNLGTGFLKPFQYMVFAIICLIAALPTVGITLIPMAILLFLYYTRKSLVIYFIPDSSSLTSMCFKRSIIEGVRLNEEDAERIIGIVGRLVERNTAR